MDNIKEKNTVLSVLRSRFWLVLLFQLVCLIVLLLFCPLKKITVFVLGVFLILDFFVIFRQFVSDNRKTILALAGIIFLCSIPSMALGINFGHDLLFHLVRIEGIAHELKLGQIPVRVSSYWMEGYGYPVSVFYGDIFLYFPALLRIAGFSFTGSYKAYIFVVNTATALVSYFCFKKMFTRRDIAMLASFAYCTANYRLVDIYIRAAVGEYTAMVFLPVVALALYGIYTEDPGDWKQYRKNALMLALGMTGILESHILSVEMTVIIIAVICIFLLRKTFRINTLKVYALAIGLTLLLNLFFIVPFIDYYLNVPVNTTDISAIQSIQSEGAYILQYFSVFQDPYGLSGVDLSGRLALTPGLVLMAALIAAAVFWVMKKADKRIKLSVLLSIGILFAASNIFPWDRLAATSSIGNLLAKIQFPWRYIAMAVITLTVLLGFLLQDHTSGCSERESRILFSAIAFAGIIMTIVFSSQYTDGVTLVHADDTDDIASIISYGVAGGEYLRSGSRSPEEMNVVAENGASAQLLSRRGTELDLYCETGEQDGMIILPMFNYKGYRVTDDTGRRYEIFDGSNKEISFTVEKGFKGNIHAGFYSPWYWRLSEAVSLLTALSLVLFLIKQKEWKPMGNREET